ncbi:MAG TPA: CheR family methyltransferase [Polyangiaceae bacterium]
MVSRRVGLWFADDKLGDLEGLLRARLRSREANVDQYLASVDEREVASLAERLTVGETFFFRYREHFEALSQDVVPALARSHLRILSIGCASGDEPYSLGIELRENAPGTTFEIHAFDVNPASVERAREGRYSHWALRETSPERRWRYFVEQGGRFALAPEARAGITFERRNLLDADAAFWKPSVFDVVFCRNVIMYFETETMRAAVARIAQSIRPGGYLFLGHAETLRGLSDDFDLCQGRDTFFYRRRDSREREAPKEGAWADVIRDASDRVASLERGVTPSSPPAREGDDEAFEPRLARALALTNEGKVLEAERECRALLAVERDARVHYLLALCRAQAGDVAGALEHDRAATDLDPTFVMPHLHIGLLERRAGNYERAAVSLARVLERLAGADSARLAAYGGGFGPESLALLCRQEIARCKERR